MYHLVTLQILPLMHIAIWNQWYYFSSSHIRHQHVQHILISTNLQFSTSNTRFSSFAKLVYQFFQFNSKRLLSLSLELFTYYRFNFISRNHYVNITLLHVQHFLEEFNDNDTHTFHYHRPCSQCTRMIKPVLYDNFDPNDNCTLHFYALAEIVASFLVPVILMICKYVSSLLFSCK